MLRIETNRNFFHSRCLDNYRLMSFVQSRSHNSHKLKSYVAENVPASLTIVRIGVDYQGEYELSCVTSSDG